MLRVKEDDAPAFQQLVEKYQARLVAVLDHVMSGRGSAEDLAQDVFLRVYRARKNYEPGAKFSTWLFTIANNVAHNARRKLSRNQEVQATSSPSGSLRVSPLETLAADASGAMPTRRVERKEMESVVRLAMESLNERQRTALVLSKFEGMSYQDIAESMQISPQAVKSLLSRARVALKASLEPYMRMGQLPRQNSADDTELGTAAPEAAAAADAAKQTKLAKKTK